MPRNGKLSVEVLVGGEQLEEHDHDGKCYVEMDLQHATSYDCDYADETPHGMERSNWPVTPFQVRVQNDHPVDHFWAELHLDGALVDMLLCKPGAPQLFKGFKEGDKLKEFLFALPRNQRVTDGDEVVAKGDAGGKSRLCQLGSLSVRTFPSAFQHEEAGFLKDYSGFRQANKIEAAKIAKERSANGGKDTMTGTAREGRHIGGSGASASGRVSVWSKGPQDKEFTVHYRQRHVLVNLGAIKAEESVASKEHIEHLLIKAREALGDRGWEQHTEAVVQLAASYRLHALPSPAACYAPSERAATFLKYMLGETRVPDCGGDAATERRALEARLGPRCALHAVCEDANSVFSAAALCLFGSGELYFLLRLVAKHEAAANPTRYEAGFADSLGGGSSRPSADLVLLALANATGRHFLLHMASDGAMPHLFRPSDFQGKSKEQPAYVIARTAGARGSGEPAHYAVLDAATADDVRERQADQVELTHSDARKAKRARERSVEVID